MLGLGAQGPILISASVAFLIAFWEANPSFIELHDSFKGPSGSMRVFKLVYGALCADGAVLPVRGPMYIYPMFWVGPANHFEKSTPLNGDVICDF